VQAIGRQPQLAPDGAPVHYERHRPEQTALYRLVQQHAAATFFKHAEAAAGADLPQFVKDEFESFLECGMGALLFLLPIPRMRNEAHPRPALCGARDPARALLKGTPVECGNTPCRALYKHLGPVNVGVTGEKCRTNGAKDTWFQGV